MRDNTMSKNVVNVIKKLSSNDALVELLINNTSSLTSISPTATRQERDEMISRVDKARSTLMNPKSQDSKILPFPFDIDATVSDGSFLRVYYNDGDFNDNETISESAIHIDIIVAKSLWLINDGTDSMIRPYEIMTRVIDMVGKRSVGSGIKLSFKGFQHLYINTKYDAIRLYAEYMSVESYNESIEELQRIR